MKEVQVICSGGGGGERVGKMIKIKKRRVQGGCMCEPRSDIPPNWNDIRTKFGYTMLGDIT